MGKHHGGLPKTEIQGLNGRGIDYVVTQKPHSIADLNWFMKPKHLRSIARIRVELEGLMC